jgi:hypothetical protein
MMKDSLEGRMTAVQEAVGLTSAGLALWPIERDPHDSLRQSIVEREFTRRAEASARRATIVAIVADGPD